jgi:hypothetical protein
MRTKISEFLDEENLNFDLNEYITVYESLDRDFLVENNYTNALYNYLGLLIKFCDTKIKLNEVKIKFEYFFKQINEASEIWPRKRKFYEKTIDLVADTQIISDGTKLMLNLMKKYEIENELSDYNYEREDIKDFKKFESFDVIKSNRKKLNLAILRIQQMYSFFVKCAYPKYRDIKNIRFKIGNWVLGQGEFLYYLSMINKKYPINEYTFLLTYNHLRHHILCDVYKIYTEEEEKERKKIFEKKLEDIKDNNCKIVLGNDNNYLDEGINDLKDVLENTKLAGKEINDSFQKFSKDLNNLNQTFT